MRRLLLINNIPTPYRTFMFQKLYDVGRAYGVEVTVAFQARREARRQWNPDEFALNFPHFFSPGARFWSRRPREFFTYGTLNLDILRRTMFGGYDFIMAAPFMSITGWLVALLPSRGVKLLWSESNLASATHRGGFAAWWKGRLLGPFRVLLCPGQRAVDYLAHFRPEIRALPVIWTPNLVDNSVFAGRVKAERARRAELRRSLRIEPDQTLIACVGQCKESKGFGQLIESVGRTPGRYKIRHVGEGPLRDAWVQRVAQLGCGDRLELAGPVPEADVVRLLAAADWFLHPPLFDPSPLVTIEAVTAGMPVAVSTYTGNAPEVVAEDRNGFTFDPLDPESFDAALRRIDATPAAQRTELGEASRALARERFDPDLVAHRFFKELTRLYPGAGV